MTLKTKCEILFRTKTQYLQAYFCTFEVLNSTFSCTDKVSFAQQNLLQINCAQHEIDFCFLISISGNKSQFSNGMQMSSSEYFSLQSKWLIAK